MRELQTLDSTIATIKYRFKKENDRKKANASSKKDATMWLLFSLTIAAFGIIFAVGGAKFTTSYKFITLAVIIGISIGIGLGVNIATFIVDKIPDFKSCDVIINSNNEVIIQNRPRNVFLTWYLSLCNIRN